MKRITEVKRGKASIYEVETLIGNKVVNKKTVDVQLATVKKNEKVYYVLYDSNRDIIEDAYLFLNHRKTITADNTRSGYAYALRHLFSYCEAFDKDYKELDKDDFIRLAYFLKGVPVDDTEMELHFISDRSSETVNIEFAPIRSFYKEMKIDAPIFDERSFAKFTPKTLKEKNPFRIRKFEEVPAFISGEEFKNIILWIRENIEDKEQKLRDECLIRVMYEGGLRLGEALGTTLEDYVVRPVKHKDTEICYVYIRNRVSDEYRDQHAKGAMKVKTRSVYNTTEYNTRNIGYELSFLSMDTYEAICEYIDIAHLRAKKTMGKRYDSRIADSVGEYKDKGKKNYYVFLNSKGTPLSQESWRTELRAIFEAVGIPVDYIRREDGLSHRFRHGFCMHLLYDLKMPKERVKFRSRHSSYSGLDKYDTPSIDQIIAEKEEIEDELFNLDDLWEYRGRENGSDS